MKFGFLKTAAITPTVELANPAANAKEIINLISKAAGLKAELMIFPEMSVTGYTCGELFLSETLIENSLKAIADIVAATKKIKGLIFIGSPILFKSKLYSCAIAISDGKVLGVIPKTALPNYGEFYELRHFSSGKGIDAEIEIASCKVPFSTKIIFQARNNAAVQVAAEICEDMFVPAPPSIKHCLAGATVIVNLSASNEIISKSDYRKTLIAASSGRQACAYVYASAGFGESVSDMVFGGHRIIAENGVLLCEAKLFEGGILISDIDTQRLSFERRRLNVFATNDEGYHKIPFDFDDKKIILDRKFSPTPFIAQNKEKRAEDILQILSCALAQKLKQTGLNAVLGLSGGLDSTLALIVIMRSYEIINRKPEKIIAVTMPGFGTSDKTLNNVNALAKSFGISVRNIPISDSVSQHLKDISHGGKKDITYENAQARARTQILMDIANSQNGFVIGTGDLSEIALGWCTYNGDHISMYGINSSVPKTLVKHLLSYEANKQKKYKAALDGVLNTEISPELLPLKDGKISQKTEKLIGSYELHDFFLYYTVRFGQDPQKTFFLAKQAFEGKFTSEEIKKWLQVFLKRFFQNQFKRNCAPDGVKIGSISLSPRADWRMPSEAQVQIWLDSIKKI